MSGCSAQRNDSGRGAQVLDLVIQQQGFALDAHGPTEGKRCDRQPDRRPYDAPLPCLRVDGTRLGPDFAVIRQVPCGPAASGNGGDAIIRPGKGASGKIIAQRVPEERGAERTVQPFPAGPQVFDAQNARTQFRHDADLDGRATQDVNAKAAFLEPETFIHASRNRDGSWFGPYQYQDDTVRRNVT